MKRKNRDDSFLDLIVSKHARHSIWLKSLTVAASMVVVAAVVLMAQPASALTDAAELGVVAEQSAEEAEQKDTTEEVQEADADTGSEDTDAESVNDEDDGSIDVSIDGTDSVEDASGESGTGSGDEGSETADISESVEAGETGESMSSEDPEDIDASDHSTDKEENAEAGETDTAGETDAADDDAEIVEDADGEIADDEIEVISESELPLELDELEIATAGDFPLELELPLEIEYAAGTLVYDGDDFYVEMNYTEDAKIPEESTLEVTRLAEDSDEFADAKSAVVDSKKEEDENFDESSLGFAAIDISIKDPDGEIIEPETGVSVRIEMKQLPEEVDHKVLSETLEVQHLSESTGETVVETVAEASDVTIVDTSAIAEFDVESFSIFTLTWTEPVPGGSAIIHFGYRDTETHKFVDFEEEKVATLDTSVASVSLENTFEGYSYIGCTYKASAAADEYDMTSSILTKTSQGWQITHKTSHEEDAETVTESIADGSEIYVYYGTVESHDPTPIGIQIPKPETKKTVEVNEDGTATITLDVTGTKITETDSVGANVLIVFDRTQSMSNRMGTRTRLQVAKDAVATLVETLDCDTNDIQLAFVPFASTGTQTQFGNGYWTSDGDAFVRTVNNTGQQSGTNWESGLYYGRQTLASRDTDATYVIFLTDGEPNRRGTTSAQSANTATAISYALTQAQAITALDNVSLYGIFCGSDSGYNNLANMISSAGGVQTINGTNEQDIEDAFENIAHTIVTNLGASGVSVDDGITDLSSVSATVSGTAGGYKYYYKKEGSDTWVEWTAENGAPGATYSKDNGVTWDLSAAGTLEAGTTYRIQFTVWPSQEALDLIANLNNGTVKYADLDDEVKAQITGNETSGYTLATNTHLNTTYTFQGHTYTDPITPLASGEMPLFTESMQVEKKFAHSINAQDPYSSIEFYLTVDGKYYQNDGTTSATLDDSKVYKLPVNANNKWKNNVFIAPGFIQNGEVLESGHKYSLEEKVLVGNEYEYEFTPQTVRPMIIDGTLNFLILKDKYNTNPEGAQEYTIDNETYYVGSTGSEGSLVGTNRKTAELDITKKIIDNTEELTEAQLDAETFTYRVTLTVDKDADVSGITAYEYVPRTGEGRFTIFGYQSDDPAPTQALAEDVDRFSGKTFGAYTVTTPGGGATLAHVFKEDGDKMTAVIDISMKRNEIIRFTNLPSGTEYTIEEVYADLRQADPSRNVDAVPSTDVASNLEDMGYSTTIVTKNGSASAEGTVVSGTIEDLDTRYYNQFTNTLNNTVDVTLKGTKHLKDYEWIGERYYFNLSATTEGAPLPGITGRTRFYVTEPSGTADKTYSFGNIRFGAPGTYVYSIAEDEAGTVKDGIKYDAAKTVTIKIGEEASTGKIYVESVEGDDTVWNADTKTATTTITNAIDTTSAEATKAWLNIDGSTTAPAGASVVFTLYADGVAKDKTITLDGTVDEEGEAESWKAVFEDLPKYKVEVKEETTTDDQGQTVTKYSREATEIKYTVVETTGYGGYTADPAGQVESGSTITNKQNAADEITAIKAWANADGTTTAPTGATVVFTLNADGKATEHTVTLDGTADTNVPKAAGGYEKAAWTASFINLPKYQPGTETEIKYTVEETTKYPGYTASPEGAVESGKTITNKQETIAEINAVKAWANADGTTAAPTGATVVFTLNEDGKATPYTVTLDGTADSGVDTSKTAGYESAAWKASFINLPKYQPGTTTEIKYTVTETTGYGGYTADPAGAVTSGSTITNKQETVDGINAVKAWVNADGTTTAPTGATVVFTLKADGKATDYTVKLDGTAETSVPEKTGGYESEAWKATFVKLPKYQPGTTTEIKYTIEETTKYPGYTASPEGAVESGSKITNTQKATKVTVNKEWLNLDGTDEAPTDEDGNPVSIEFTLFADDVKTEHVVVLDGTAEEKPASSDYESAEWEATFDKLPMYQKGTETEIKYTVKETGTVDGYEQSPVDGVETGGTITNKQLPADEIYATKAWKNADGTMTAPEGASVEFMLLRDGKDTAHKVTLNGEADPEPAGMGGYEKEAWKASFVKLPKYKYETKDGKLIPVEIEYTIKETTGYPGYTVSPADAVESGGEITNTQDEIEKIEAAKAWKNADGTEAAPAGASVVFTLYADGEATEYTAKLDGTADTDVDVTKTVGYESEAWKATFVHLPKYQAGTETEIAYTVVETEGFTGYTTSGDPVSDKGTITNEQETVEVNASKAWENADGSATAPEGASVVFTLYKDGETAGKTVTLDGTVDEASEAYESAAWVASFVNLPKYRYEEEGGVLKAVEIAYTVDETIGYRGYENITGEPVATDGIITNKEITAKIRLLKIGDSNTSVKLSGVEFKLFYDEELKKQVTKDATGAEIGKAGLITTGEDGTFELGTLSYGTYYLKETKSKEGYKLVTEAIKILVMEDGTVEYIQEDYKGAEVTKDGDTFIVTIDNKKGTSLPSTGGVGTTIFYILGSILMAGAATLLAVRKRLGE